MSHSRWVPHKNLVLSQFGGSSINRWWVITWTSSGLTHTQPDAGNENGLGKNDGISIRISLKCIPCGLVHCKSTLDEVMAWCHQAISCYVSKCVPKGLIAEKSTLAPMKYTWMTMGEGVQSPQSTTKSSERVQNIRRASFAIHGPPIFNSLPKYVRNTSKCDLNYLVGTWYLRRRYVGQE